MASNPFQLDPAFTQQITQPAPQPHRGGMFGGGLGQIIAAALSGYTASSNPGPQQALFAMMAQKRQQQLAESQYQRERQDKQTDWQTQYNYELANPKQTEPHYFQNNSGDELYIGQDGKPVEAYHDPMRWKFVPNGMGGVVPVDITKYMGGGAAGAPQPLTDADILRMQGGQTPQASGGFPGR